MATSASVQKPKSALSTILLAWLTAGTLDLLGAIIVYDLIMKRVTAVRLLQGIASGAFGKKAFDGGNTMALYGIGFHYLIALTFTIFFFVIFPYISFLKKYKILAGLLYGIFVWMVMNLAVLPMLHIGKFPTKWDAIARGAIILMFCIGLPISLIVNRYYSRK